MTRAALLPALALLAACGGQTGEQVQAEEAKRAEVVANLKGIERAFDSPETAVAAANQFGFRIDGYRQSGLRWQAAGEPIFVADTQAKAPNRARFVAMGPDQSKIDTMRFTLDVTDPADAARAKTRFAKMIDEVLWQFRAQKPEALGKAIAAEQPFEKTLDGATAAVSVAPIPQGDKTRRITVTFTRPGATGQAS
ncbi:DUF6030 family protein [Sphingomonas sp.]|uniref:DUF6030 family protein n=1 Tax=Sphingomonas sp. TaxID=28214 RepID=UPI0031DD0DB6